ncbi:rRNA methyltransferase 3A, mitochondrial [Anthonomus grandis grandis]|uniref:rRNA methyltransferase 3A, mitochondrial n=1 Tax=Anthonomus grandis grandis TaxID=2921223 RepID=UPI0021655A60|nr:rRNA methyltransferase 3A, mitochondrial [Anthonomus grandis grandis]
MANLFKNLISFRQQIRCLPRFSQTFPAEKPTTGLRKIEPLSNESSLEPLTEPAKPINRHPKFKPLKNSPEALVIKPAKKGEFKTKFTHNFNKPAEEIIIDNEGNLCYTKLENNDPKILKMMSQVKTQRKSKNLVLLEGKRLIKEALEANCKFECILFSRVKDIECLKPYLPKKGKLYKMPYREIQMWSDLTTNPGIMGIFQVPEDNAFHPKEYLPLTIICDNIREPTNLGAIIRTSSGVGCEEMLLTKGCTNLWDSKVLRSSSGAHFKVHFSRNLNWDELKQKIPKNSQVFIADNNVVSSDTQLTNADSITAELPVVPYFSVNFNSQKHIVLIIGGETEGINEQSYKLAKEFDGVRLNVPLSNGIDSLNVGTALGVIGFEIKRQLAMELKKDEKLEAVHPHYL